MNCRSSSRRSSTVCASRSKPAKWIARANHRVVYPARFQLIAAMNPCRCGSANEPGYACKRAPNELCAAQYLGRLSGPLLDRFDLVVDVPSVSAADLMTPAAREGSAEVAARVGAARKIQIARYAELGLESVVCNAGAPASIVEEIAEADASGLALLRRRAAAPLGARLSPGPEARPHPRRPRRRRPDPPRPTSPRRFPTAAPPTAPPQRRKPRRPEQR